MIIILLKQHPAENSGSSTSSASSGGSGNYGTLGRNANGGQTGMASMMDEMARTLARRRAAVEKKEPTDCPQVIEFTHLNKIIYPSPYFLIALKIHNPCFDYFNNIYYYFHRMIVYHQGIRKIGIVTTVRKAH